MVKVTLVTPLIAIHDDAAAATWDDGLTRGTGCAEGMSNEIVEEDVGVDDAPDVQVFLIREFDAPFGTST